MKGVKCYKAKGIDNCDECEDKKKCNAYGLIMDLTARRDICPLDPSKEYCPRFEKHRK